ncbi:MAG: FAD-dependent oxidoreductase, partial [Candidatus Thermoplasmatota archaeon]
MIYDVAIIGGGINGSAIAYELAKKDTKVIVLEREYLASGATGRCGGGIRQQWATKENIELAHQSVKIFEQLSKELEYDIEYEQSGYLVLAHTEKEFESFKENVKLQKSLGLDVRVLEKDEITEIVPFIDVEGARAVGATYCPTDGHANPFKTTYGYANRAKEMGARFKTFTEVNKIKKEKDNFCLLTVKDKIYAEKVVNATGEYAPQIAKNLGLKLPITPYRHEILATEPLEPILKPMIISFTDGIYFCQHKTGQIVGGIGNPEEKPGINLNSSLDFLKRMASVITRYIPA